HVDSYSGRAQISPRESRHLVDGLDRIYQRLVEIHPEAAQDEEVRQTLCYEWCKTATYLASRDKLRSLSAYRHAFKGDPSVALSSLRTYLSLLVLGELSRTIYRRYLR